MINVYRGITGKFNYVDGEQLFEGCSVADLAKQGICNSNNSNAQYPQFDDILDLDDDFDDRYVPGLPVFLNLNEAVGWVTNKSFKHTRKGLAVIAIAHIDEEAIASGEIQIVRNTLARSGNQDRLLTLQELLQHQYGEKRIRGECYIPSFPCEEMLASTNFLVARLHGLDGHISQNIAPAFVDLAVFENR